MREYALVAVLTLALTLAIHRTVADPGRSEVERTFILLGRMVIVVIFVIVLAFVYDVTFDAFS